ncbi:MAG: translation initiation factor IF-2 [Bacillota bacterium]
MSKHQIHNIAEELHTTSAKVVTMLEEIGVVVKGANSSIDDEQLEKLYKKAGVKPGEANKAELKPRSKPLVVRQSFINHDVDISADKYGRSTIKKVDSSSGLRAGFTHDEEEKALRKKNAAKFDEPQKDASPIFKKKKVEPEPEPEVVHEPIFHKKPKVEIVVENEVEKTTEVSIEPQNETAEIKIVTENLEVKAETIPELKVEIEEKIDILEVVADEIIHVPEIISEVVEIKNEELKVITDKDEKVEKVEEVVKTENLEPRPTSKPFTKPYSKPYSKPETKPMRPMGDRPQGPPRPYVERPVGGAPQGGAPRTYGDRPAGGAPRPYGDRPAGGAPRPYGDRPAGGAPRPYGDRPAGGAPRPYGDRPAGGAPRPFGDRPAGGAPRPYGDRSFGAQKDKGVEIPKAEGNVGKEEPTRSAEDRGLSRSKEKEKEFKKEQKRDTVKGSVTTDRNNKIIPNVFTGKKGVNEVMSDEFVLNEFYSGSDARRRRNRRFKPEQPKYIPPKVMLTNISLPETISVKELAEGLKKTAADIIKRLMALGLLVTVNSELDYDTAAIICEEYEITPEKQVVVSEEDRLFDDAEEEDESLLVPRDPVVVVMGHVDHGKTSLLDAIRDTNVIKGEAGGITQHIGAYRVMINGRNICFLDTPGHEAFTAMRARGAQVTDVAVLVVAADDGVMPQTVEALDHAKAAGVKIVVAINKIDKEGANPDKIKQELTEHGIVSSEWGGDTEFVNVSAKQRLHIEDLLEIILLEADVLELKANPNKQAKGTVIEAKLDKGRGPVATILVQRGTLNDGDTLFTGSMVGRIRAMVDDTGKKIKKAGPSTPVEIIGLPDVPVAGEVFYAVSDEKLARQLAEKRKTKLREQALKASSTVSLDDLYKQITEGIVKDLHIIVKADVAGSVEAIKQAIEKLSNDEVRVNVIHGGVGAISESDVTLAQVSNSIIIGFNVRPGKNVAEIAEAAGVDLRMYSVIYNAIEEIQTAMKGMLEPTFKEVILGHAEVREMFKVTNVGTICGSYITDGKITRNAQVRVVRGGIVVFEGTIASLKRFKDDAKEVATGFECGIMIEKFNEFQVQDVIEAYMMEEVKRD